MAQNWTDDVFALSHEGETDLQNIENNFQALKSLFSGATFVLTPTAGQPYFDTNTSILGQGLLKIRNRTNSGWMGVLALSQESNNGLVWFHGNDMSNQEGWAIDTSITEDRVMALKNHGSGTYTTGRTVAGQWTIDDMNTIPQHRHTTPNHVHYLLKSGSILKQTGPLEVCVGSAGNIMGARWPASDAPQTVYRVYDYTESSGNSNTGYANEHTPTNAGTWRIRAQVGIVIYPDI